MDQRSARILVNKLITRLEESGNEQWQFQCIVTSLELKALKVLVGEQVSDLAHFASEISLPNTSETLLQQVVSDDETMVATPSIVENGELDNLQYQSVKSYSKIENPKSHKEQLAFDSKDDSLLATSLCDFLLPSSLDNIKAVLLRALGDNSTLAQLVEISDEELIKSPSLGKKKLKKVRALQRDLLKNKYRTESHSDFNNITTNCIFDGLDDVPLDDLEQVLLDDIEQYIEKLDDRSRYIFVNRNGWKTTLKTLEEVGRTLPDGGVITRERIRQLQKKIDNNFTRLLRVSPRTLWVNIKSNLSLWSKPLFPKLRSNFSKEEDYYRFLELCCSVKDGRIISVTKPIVSNAILDDFWTESISPVHYSKIVDYLQSEHGFEHAVAENALIRLKEKGVLTIEGGHIIPRLLTKHVAVAHVALFFPDAAPWITIHRKANELAVSKSVFPLDRQDSGITAAVDNGWIYQSGQGEYHSLSKIDINESDIDSTLSRLKECLGDEKRDGRNAINLSVDFHKKKPQSLGYFIVRHIVRSYGEKYGIFFSGKSGADTVSLDSEFSLASQKLAIVQMFVEKDGPLTKRDIAQFIRSKSVNHAAFYIEKLIREEKIVRISAMEYALTSKAFESINIPKIVKSIAIFLAGESRVVEGEVLQRHLNREFDLEKNKYFYLSLLRIHARRLGYDWYYSRSLVSKIPLSFSSGAELYRQIVAEGINDNEDILRHMVKKLRADDHYLTNTIYANN